MSIPEDCLLVREPPRPSELRQPGFEDEFDYRSLWFDVFQADRDIRLSGPPLLNLAEAVRSGTWRVDGRDVSDRVHLVDRGHAQESVISDVSGLRLTLSTELFEVEAPIGPDYRDAFVGKRAIYTKSRNNDLRWIQDWLHFHAEINGVSAALIYDNGSDRYGADELLEAIETVPGIDTGLVVSWPYRFGPQAGASGRFDSDFFEYVVSSNAQRRFLGKAAGAIHADIDELVMAEDGRSVFDHASESQHGYVRYHGRVIEGVPVGDPPDGAGSFADYGYYDPSKPLSTSKWTCIPSRLSPDVQWRTHAINGLDAPIHDGVIHRHFFAISTSWKFRRGLTDLDVEHLEIDERLRAAFRKAGLV